MLSFLTDKVSQGIGHDLALQIAIATGQQDVAAATTPAYICGDSRDPNLNRFH